MKKVVIAAEVFSSNLGDYAIYDSLSKLLLSKNVEAIPLDISFRRGFPISSTGPQLQSANNNWKSLIPKNVKHHKLTQYMITRTMWYLVHRQNITNYWSELISNSDAVIIGGGQLLTDTSANFHTKIALITDIANKFNKPICILGCGVGSNLGRKAQKNIRNIIKSTSFISLRDSNSADRLKDFITKDILLNIYPDLAFALNSATNNSTFQKNSEQKESVCGFNIMPLSAFKKHNPNLKDIDSEAYIAFWKQLARDANKENMKVHIMTNGSIPDYEQAKSIYKSIFSEGIDVILIERPTSPLDLYHQISNVDYLITMRMHAGIIGQAFGCTVATIVWDDKIPGVWNTVGYEGVALDSNVLKSEDPWEKVNKSFQYSETLSKYQAEISNKVVISIDECLKAIFSNSI